MVTNPNYYSKSESNPNEQITDGVDFPHTGIIKALSDGLGQNYAISGFDITIDSATQIDVGAGVIFRDGKRLAVAAVNNLTLSASYSNGYHLLIANNHATAPVLTIRNPTAVNLVPEYTAGDTIIAVITHNGTSSVGIQYLTLNKTENNLSIGYDDSGYTETLSVVSDAGHTDITAKVADKDIRFKGTDSSSDITALTLDMSEAGKALFNAGASLQDDVTIYEDANNADVSLSLGTSAAESLTISVLNGGSNKTAEEIHFSTATASATANHGKMVFDVDGTDIATIDDGGIDLASGKTFSINGTDIVSSPITAVNNATENELVTIGATTTELEAEANLTFDGSTLGVTGAVTATTTVTGNKLAGNALGFSSHVVNANDGSPTIDGDYSNIFVHALGGSNNEVVLASISAGNAMEAGRVITIKNTDASDTIIIGTSSGETIEQDRVEHPMIVTANKINLAPFESVTIRAETDSKESLSTTGFLIVDSIGAGRGKQSIYVPAAAMYPNTTNGCAALAQVELGNGPELKSLDFDKDSEEFAQFTVAFPKSWDNGTVSFQAFFTADSTNTGTTAWGLAGISFADNDLINTTFDTAVVATAKAHSGTANDMNVSNESNAITIKGSPSANEMVYFEIHRDVGTDSLTADAKLLGIKLFYTTNAGNDV